MTKKPPPKPYPMPTILEEPTVPQETQEQQSTFSEHTSGCLKNLGKMVSGICQIQEVTKATAGKCEMQLDDYRGLR